MSTHEAVTVDFTALLFNVLGFTADEFVSIGHDADGEWRTVVRSAGRAPDFVDQLPDTANIYFGVNPTRGPERVGRGRGTEADVTRLSALWCDLDVKPGACPDLDTAHTIIGDLTGILHTRPTVIVHTGHGLRPYWPVGDSPIRNGDISRARSLVRRWGRLVAVVAAEHGVEVDSVFDLARMLRVPGTINNKERVRMSTDSSAVLRVVAHAGAGIPLLVAEIDERLTKEGIGEEDDDTAVSGEVISSPADWAWAQTTHPYVTAIIDGLPTDGPKNGKGRHQWPLHQAVRLACAHRLGLITEEDSQRARRLLKQRFTELVRTTEPRREPGKYEIEGKTHSAWGYGIKRASEKTDAQARAELGDREPYDDEPPDVDDHHAGEYNPGEHPPTGGQDKAEESRLTPLLLTRSALRQLPDPEPLIDDVLDQATNALLYGYWGTCKTFIALDWAASVATGRPWQGHTTEQRRVLYIAAEGAFGLKARIDAWEQGWNQSIGDDDLHILPRSVNLTHYGEFAELVTLVRQNGYGFVVIDTLARCMVGADENSAKDCGEVVAALLTLRQATPEGRGCVTGVHHTGKDGKTFRGSSVFEAGADTVYAVRADEAVINLDRQKRRDGPRDDHHELKLDLIDGSGSGVISVHRGGGQTDRADRLLSTFVHHFSETGASKAELRLVAEMAQGTFYRALSDLLKRRDLVNTGTEKRPFYKLVSK